MKIIKLNCVACGAPVTVPDNMEIFFCSSCGSKLAVDRGEGAITLNLIERLTKEVKESAGKTQDAIKENTQATKIELKRVQISHTLNTEEIKLNTTRQEIRSLTRKVSLLAIEQTQLTMLRLVECDILQRMRKLKLEYAKLDEGWQDSLEVFQDDLAALDQIIQILKPYAADEPIKNRLLPLLEERTVCEKDLSELEMKLIRKQLRSSQYAPLNSLSLEETLNLQSDIQSDLKTLAVGPVSATKQQLINEMDRLYQNAQKILPRKKVEVETGLLGSLDYSPPYPEIPWQLIPMIEQVNSDLQKVANTPESPEKARISNELGTLLLTLKKRQAQDIPSRKLKAAKRRKIFRTILVLVLIGFVAAILVLWHNGVFKQLLNGYGLTRQSEVLIPANRFEETNTNFIEIEAQKTYLHSEADIHSKESSELKHGDILFNLGQSDTDTDWYWVETFTGEEKGYLYEQWVNPFVGNSVRGTALKQGGASVYQEDFSGIEQDWPIDSFAGESGQGDFLIRDKAYQIDSSLKNPGYVYSKLDLKNLPQDFIYSIDLQQLSSDPQSACGFITNFMDGENFDYFLLTSENDLIVGYRKNGSSYTLYDTGKTPNNKYYVTPAKPNTLSIQFINNSENGSTTINYAVNGAVIYSLRYDQKKEINPTIGLIVWTMENDASASCLFDNISVSSQ